MTRPQVERAAVAFVLVMAIHNVFADTIDDCIDGAMAMQVGRWAFSGRLENYGVLSPLHGSVTISRTPDGKYRNHGAIGGREDAWDNVMSVAELRSVTYNGDAVTSTRCSLTQDRYLIVQRYRRTTEQGDTFEYEAKTTGSRDWQLFIDQWRRADTTDPFRPFLTRWSTRE